MKYLIICLNTLLIVFIVSCTGKKTTSNQLPDSTQIKIATKLPLPDSIDQAIGVYDRRLDIKMRRKTYEPQPGNLVTLQKWFEYGDTTRLVKLREEIITGTTKMEVSQYHYLNRRLAEIHDYSYNKKCDGNQKQCIQEAKYFFRNDTLDSAVRREATGTNDSVPVIERVAFQRFKPTRTLLKNQQERLIQINKKYTSLPYANLSKSRQ